MGGASPAVSDGGRSQAATDGDDGPAPSDRLPATLRLRSAGFGVVIGGVALAVLSVLLPYAVVAGLLAGGALVGGVLVREDGTLLQLCLGVGSVGVIGLFEALSTVGFGLDPVALGALAVAFGVVDIMLGSALSRLRPGEP